ncbi:hypothetical protein ZOSMA_151G00130 [Zostera marina]|uniref:Uncharacterized protein n=1 Tax=Zostera marina TaxID=29655 RepID=A0A0K9PY92_ZOSMR|nr:hypothetical protein ZOSMA_151G00130 [Zostera marina]
MIIKVVDKDENGDICPVFHFLQRCPGHIPGRVLWQSEIRTGRSGGSPRIRSPVTGSGDESRDGRQGTGPAPFSP